VIGHVEEAGHGKLDTLEALFWQDAAETDQRSRQRGRRARLACTRYRAALTMPIKSEAKTTPDQPCSTRRRIARVGETGMRSEVKSQRMPPKMERPMQKPRKKSDGRD
jgi:hypothetical protein